MLSTSLLLPLRSATTRRAACRRSDLLADRAARRFFARSRQTFSPTALVFDTETTGRVDFGRPPSDPCQPDLVQLGLLLVDTATWDVRHASSSLVRLREGVAIEPGAQATHGIAEADCRAYGVDPATAVRWFDDVVARADVIVAHNLAFDAAVMDAARHRADPGGSAGSHATSQAVVRSKRQICTMQSATNVMKLPGKFPGGYKWPTLAEAYRYATHRELEDGHDALVDAQACLRVFRYLVEEGIVELDAEKEDAEEKEDVEESRPASTWEAELAAHGLTVTHTARGFAVGGHTFAAKEMLKARGGRWDGRRKHWRFADPDAPARLRELARQLSSSPPPTEEAARRE